MLRSVVGRLNATWAVSQSSVTAETVRFLGIDWFEIPRIGFKETHNFGMKTMVALKTNSGRDWFDRCDGLVSKFRPH